ncbi:MAG: 2-C-methyl-D-erythritol 2,4-cyclodiphosphate synthase [Bacteroidetes bacterium]|nr:2-C-methyl-D-erythritol 2,4-cyclodiphosphate synthase [Bacteroidota bacterium]
MRVGFGYDVHQLVPNRRLILGGIEIPHDKGCLGHSDGDVVIHALCDAMLGAANLRDIGYHFPDNNQQYKDIDSTILLKEVIKLLAGKNYELVNLDSTICLQSPKLKDYIPDMQKRLAEVISCLPDQISLKATTTEKMGFVGEEKGVSCYAVVLLQKNN